MVQNVLLFSERPRHDIHYGGFQYSASACISRRSRSKKHGGQQSQALDRSRGGFSTKIHGVCDARGNFLHFILTPGQKSDCKQAIPLIQNLRFDALIADKAYDTNHILEHLKSIGSEAVIPPKANRIIQRSYNKDLYKQRHKIENSFGFLKHFRRLAFRFDKLASRFLAFLHFTSTILWIK